MAQLSRFGVTTAPFSQLKNWRRHILGGLCQLIVCNGLFGYQGNTPATVKMADWLQIWESCHMQLHCQPLVYPEYAHVCFWLGFWGFLGFVFGFFVTSCAFCLILPVSLLQNQLRSKISLFPIFVWLVALFRMKG